MRTVVAVWAVAAAVAGCAGGGGTTPTKAPAPIENLPGNQPDLPPPQTCSDPIAGTWTTRVWREEAGKWDQVTLTIARVGLTELRGQIAVDTWAGDESDDEPPVCPDGSHAVTKVVELGAGWIRGTQIDFAGSEPERVGLPCGQPVYTSYNPDHFTGHLAPPELVTVNDDGSSDRDRPHVFTRVACPR